MSWWFGSDKDDDLPPKPLTLNGEHGHINDNLRFVLKNQRRLFTRMNRVELLIFVAIGLGALGRFI